MTIAVTVPETKPGWRAANTHTYITKCSGFLRDFLGKIELITTASCVDKGYSIVKIYFGALIPGNSHVIEVNRNQFKFHPSFSSCDRRWESGFDIAKIILNKQDIPQTYNFGTTAIATETSQLNSPNKQSGTVYGYGSNGELYHKDIEYTSAQEYKRKYYSFSKAANSMFNDQRIMCFANIKEISPATDSGCPIVSKELNKVVAIVTNKVSYDNRPIVITLLGQDDFLSK